MPVYKAPARETRFIINEVLKLGDYAHIPGFESASADMVDTIVDEAGKFISEVVAPLNLSGDQEGCTQGPAVVTGQRAGGRLGEQDAVAGQDDDEKERLERRVGDDPHAEEEGDEHQPGEGQASQHPGAGGQGGIEAGSGRGEPVVEGQHAACQGQGNE